MPINIVLRNVPADRRAASSSIWLCLVRGLWRQPVCALAGFQASESSSHLNPMFGLRLLFPYSTCRKFAPRNLILRRWSSDAGDTNTPQSPLDTLRELRESHKEYQDRINDPPRNQGLTVVRGLEIESVDGMSISIREL